MDLSKGDRPPQLDYESRVQPISKNRLRLIVWLLVIGVCLAVTCWALLPTSHYRNCDSNSRSACASNMHQLGLAMLLYSSDHQGVYPNTLSELFEEQIQSKAFVCPLSTDTASTGATTQQIDADFRTGGHLSYIYLGSGQTEKTLTADTVLLYESAMNHQGMHVLFGDGHVEWINPVIGNKLVAAVASGHRSVTMNGGAVVATQPATAP